MISKICRPAIIIFFVFLFISCDDNQDKPIFQFTDPCEIVNPTPDILRYFPVYEKPIIISPDISETPVFYSDEIVDIKWELPDGLWNSQLQIIEFNHPYDCMDYEKFHQLKNNFTAGYGNQFINYFQLNQYNGVITDTVYVAYRIRSTDISSPQKYSLWTDVNTFTMVPLVNLRKDVIEVSYNFNFITEELNEFYYSGFLKKDNYRLSNIAQENNLNFDKIRFIRPVNFETNFVTKYENNRNPFSRILIGFSEDFDYNSEFYPFEVIGDVYPGSYQESPIEGRLYQTYTRNFLSDMNNFDLKVAYKLEDVPGNMHEVVVTLTYEIFSDY